MMPLTMAKAGETVTIKKITGKDEIRLHLAELGFVVDSEVTVVNEIAGNHEPQLCQMQPDFVLAGDLFDGDRLSCFCHRQRHHIFRFPSH